MFKYIFLFVIFFTLPVNAHTFTGMVGFYDGLSHPVLGLDHFLAMVSVGILRSLIGGRAIWTIPSLFVFMMIIGGVLGMILEMNLLFLQFNIFFISNFVEIGIILSVILLGLAIVIQKQLNFLIVMFFISIFGLCHGLAHGMEIPWAANPILFALGFSAGTATLHIFGVGIGIFANQSNFSNWVLRIFGVVFVIYGVYLLV